MAKSMTTMFYVIAIGILAAVIAAGVISLTGSAQYAWFRRKQKK